MDEREVIFRVVSGVAAASIATPAALGMSKLARPTQNQPETSVDGFASQHAVRSVLSASTIIFSVDVDVFAPGIDEATRCWAPALRVRLDTRRYVGNQ